METVTIFMEGVDALKNVGGEDFRLCFQCAKCAVSCPWNSVREFPLRRLLRQAQFGLVDLADEDWWMCTTCGLCPQRCPRGVNIIDVMRATRRIMVSAGIVPSSLQIAMTNIASLGNPFGQPREERAEWAEGLELKAFTANTEVLYFPCCTVAYDARLKQIGQAMARVMKSAAIDFGILGSSENCCGESVRKAGNENLFQSLAEANIKTFTDSGVTKIVASSPHCYHAFTSDYPSLGSKCEVLHHSQYLKSLLDEKRIKFTGSLNKKVAYHDPCYLGRHHSIYDEPREVLRSIPGVELVELINTRENSLCCGGGGGRIWMETKKGERFADLRLAEAINSGAEILATSCPYCILNFEDSLLTADNSDIIQVKDISELVAEAL